jgi:phospholipid/cholesterol/gamma-HCH transport system substrate-binding protein
MKDLPTISNQMKETIEHINLMSNDVAQAGKSVSSTMKSARYSIDKFNQQAIPPAVNLINRLNQIATTMEQITQDMEQNPAILIRGKQISPSGPGE